MRRCGGARAVVLAALAVAVSSNASGAQDGGLDAFRTAFREARAPHSTLEGRREALEQLAGDSKNVVEALLAAATVLEAEAVRIEEIRRRSLFETETPDIELQRRTVLDPLRELQQHIGWRLIEIDDADAIEAMVTAALDDDELPFTLRLKLAERAGEVEDALGSRLVAKLRRKTVGEACVALVAFLACDARPQQTVAILIKQLAHKSPLVRELAAHAMADHPHPKSVQALVKRIERERGRTRKRMVAALEILSRVSLGDRPDAWQRWWKDHRDDVLGGQYVLGRGTSSALITGALGNESAPDADSRRYHSLSVDGDAILFVLDRSGSMSAPMRDGPNESGSAVTRMDRAKAELVQTLRALPAESTFNVVAFSTGAAAFEQRMMPATADNIADAAAWIEGRAPDGGTALYDGADYAFVIGDRPVGDVPHELAFDTMFILTDGLPTRPRAEGRNREFEEDSFDAILFAVERWNLLDRVVVNAIALGQDFPARHLRALAEDNGGRLVQEL